MKHPNSSAAAVVETSGPSFETTSLETRWLEQHMAVSWTPRLECTANACGHHDRGNDRERKKGKDKISLPVWLGGSITEAALVNAPLASLRQILVPGQLKVDTRNRGLSHKTSSLKIDPVPFSSCLVVLGHPLVRDDGRDMLRRFDAIARLGTGRRTPSFV